MITLRILNEEPLEDLREAIATTIGKERLSDWKPTKEGIHKDLFRYYAELFIANHSIVRSVHFRIKIDNARKDVTRQLLRATKGHPQPFVESSRPDWTGVPRDENATNRFTWDHTPESFITMAQQRLCFRAMKETRQEVFDIIRAMWDSGEPLLEAVAFCSVPSCVFQMGCPEGKQNCGWFDSFEFDDIPADLWYRREWYKETEK